MSCLQMLSICDIVLNHTANETPWLNEHPEATYNCSNCPHLRPAALLDALLARLTADVARGDHEARGVPARVTAHEHLEVRPRPPPRPPSPAPPHASSVRRPSSTCC